ncbi:hypothetical protein VTN31DRAFT_7017 [Thermomyces dupontii]|uniref:uncharacterized protein n=1 Tax=Talaromyces thermophilus TaxID=28565 RepID=UPI003742C95E
MVCASSSSPPTTRSWGGLFLDSPEHLFGFFGLIGTLLDQAGRHPGPAGHIQEDQQKDHPRGGRPESLRRHHESRSANGAPPAGESSVSVTDSTAVHGVLLMPCYPQLRGYQGVQSPMHVCSHRRAIHAGSHEERPADCPRARLGSGCRQG